MTVPLTVERKRAAIARARQRVEECDKNHHEAYEAAWLQPFSQTLQRRADAALRDLEAAQEKLERITKEYGETTCNS